MMRKITRFKLFLFVLLVAVNTQLSGQTPTNQDCPGAIAICNSTYNYASSFVGEGNYPNEVSTSSCMASSENYTVWFTFTAQSTGNVGFLITPNNSSDDYDWAVYDITGVGCTGSTLSNSLMVSCNYSSADGDTGPNNGSTSSSQGASGTPFNAYIPATNGNNYVIVIDNYSQSSNGFSVNFGSSPTSIVDNSQPQILSVTTPSCGANTLTFSFSESVLCNTVQTSDFTLTGPGGPYTISNVTSTNCGDRKSVV